MTSSPDTDSAARPIISVLVTVCNAQHHIGGVVEMLDRQELDGRWEIVVCVGPSNDKTLEALSSMTANHPRLVVAATSTPGIPAGRNAAVRASSASLLLFCDADDEPEDGWLATMASSLREHRLVAGSVQIRTPTGTDGTTPKTLDSAPYLHPYGYLPYGLTANLGVRRSVWDLLGGFDERMRWGDDVDFTWRAQERGVSLGRCDALVYKVARSTPWARFRQHYRFGRTDVLLFKAHRDKGMPRHLARAVKTWVWLVGAAPLCLRRRDRFRWAGVLGHRIGRLAESAKQRTLYL